MDKPATAPSDKFEKAARGLGCGDDSECFNERPGELVKHEPVEKPA